MHCAMNELLKSALLLCALAATGLQAQPARFTEALGQLHQQLQQSDRQGAAMAEDIVRQWVDVRSIAVAAFGQYVEQSLESYREVLDDRTFSELVELYEGRLTQAVGNRLVVDLGHQLDNPALAGVELRDLRGDAAGNTASLAAINAHGGTTALSLEMAADGGTWRIVRIAIDGRDLGEHYRALCSDIVAARYSLPVLVSRLEEMPYIAVEDFAQTPIGQTPLDWGSWREKDKGKPRLYRVHARGEQRYIAASDSGYSVILGKFVHWNPREYPIMTWCWRANAIPPGGNEFLDHANDSAAGLYVIFSQNWLHVPKQLKYVWSSTLPEGTVGRRKKIFRPWFFVLESGEENLGQWTFEQVDLERDHRLKLGGLPSERTIGLGLLTDANSTRSYAEAFYADMRVWKREALERRQIADYCGGLRDNGPTARRGSALWGRDPMDR